MISPGRLLAGWPRRNSSSICVLVGAVTAVALAIGCSMMNNSPSPMPSGQTISFAFVSNSGSGTVSAFAIDANGALSTVSGSPFAAAAGAEFMAFDSVHKLLFVNNQTANSVSAFSTNTTTGLLTPVAGSPFAAGSRPTAVAVDPAGRFVFVANQASNSIGVFSIGENGTLTQITGSPFAASSPYGLSVNSAGTVLYATNFPDSQVSDLNTVSALAINASGSLSPIAGSPFPDANGSSGFASGIGILADPSGKFVFVGDHMAESVVPFSVSADGALAPISALPTPASSCGSNCHNNPLRLAVDPADKFLLSTNVEAGTVSIFGITGGSGLMSLSQATTGAHPFGVAVDPSGGFVYVVNKSDATISGFQLNSASGMLSPLPNFPMTEGQQAPTDIVIVPKM